MSKDKLRFTSWDGEDGVSAYLEGTGFRYTAFRIDNQIYLVSIDDLEQCNTRGSLTARIYLIEDSDPVLGECTAVLIDSPEILNQIHKLYMEELEDEKPEFVKPDITDPDDALSDGKTEDSLRGYTKPRNFLHGLFSDDEDPTQ